MKGYFVQIDKINHLQCESIERLIERCKHAHWTDIDMRINGQNERFQADWIKHMLALPECDDVTVLQMENAALRSRLANAERVAKHYITQSKANVASAESATPAAQAPEGDGR